MNPSDAKRNRKDLLRDIELMLSGTGQWSRAGYVLERLEALIDARVDARLAQARIERRGRRGSSKKNPPKT